MDPLSPEPKRRETDARSGVERDEESLNLSRPLAVGAGAFGLFLAFMRFYHPLLFTRHLDRVLLQCAEFGAVAFGLSLWITASKRHSDD